MTTTAPHPGTASGIAALARDLPELDTSTLGRGLYSSDSSIYRVVPQAVLRPRSREDLIAAVRAGLAAGIPITVRGAGTSCAGNAVGTGLVLDVRQHLRTIHSIDPQARTAVVDPGVVQSELQRAAAPYGLRFGPDPSTATRCTIGGMIGNNACGPRAMGYGRSADNVVALEIIDGTGNLVTVRNPQAGEVIEDPLTSDLRALVGTQADVVRREFGTFGRQVSGYSLEHLLPESFQPASFFAGTEGTLGVIVSATVRLVPDPEHRRMIALGYPSMPDAADAVPALRAYGLTACEGLDRRIVEVVRRRRGESAVPPLPRGDGWIFVEVAGDDLADVDARAAAVLDHSGALDGWVVIDEAHVSRLWKIRSDGAGLAGVSLSRPAYAGWEDAAVPPERLGDYLRAFDALLGEHGLAGLPYGHFGDGCIHCRIDFDLDQPGGPQRYAAFVTAAADVVASFGGSMSGEHGDGRARSALLPAMYSPAALALMADVKRRCDPDNLLNPGVLVGPEPGVPVRPVAADIRVASLPDLPLVPGTLAAEVHRCTGVGACLTASGGIMCPSYRATGDEKDSTRGRARILQELVNGSLVTRPDAAEVHDALDLCLSCKGCSRDCPTGVDMASYKSIVTDQAWAGKVRPLNHYALGWLPRWTQLMGQVPGLARFANAALRLPVLGKLGARVAGVDTRRKLPSFAAQPASRRLRRTDPPADGVPVVLWVDSFTEGMAGAGSLGAIVAVLTAAGFAPRLLERNACCGLTWISTGQREGARRQLRSALDVLHPVVADGVPVVGVEPSCLAVWRSDAAELLPEDPRVAEVAAGVHTLAEVLARAEEWTGRAWQPPQLTGVRIVAQPHCHHASVLGWETDAALLRGAGAEVEIVEGCCGLAGNFGVEAGHAELSKKVFDHDLGPAVAKAAPDTVILADGFSCRHQLSEYSDRTAASLAELLADRITAAATPTAR
ncbi:FAD-binding and (Fe-S)-binding domain-containing protein [Parenemella sanctibonifatiensis]|uniref:FAD-binding and (Fe-S)-binding domain-containing protein n=1 Tax=Parenemella sanctibonifatiensis TaxID=2016505 RepID=UPI001E5A2EBA|nr:FAD-binding and (Fe-S)-binding domain-containing protein [Parenemella sanctibonifatiensis]